MEQPQAQTILRPHPGRQTQFLQSKADIVIYGGAGGGGKSYGLLMDAARHVWTRGYVAKIFRRTYKQVKQDGGIWDKTFEIYPKIGLMANNSELFWENRETGSTVGFGNLETDADRYNYDGAELAYIGFDEIQHFTAKPFWHLLSRNRTTCGVRAVFRGTCNPDPDCFVKPLIRWWLDEAGQFPDLSKAGVIRWFTRSGDGEVYWHDTDQAAFWDTVDTWRREDPLYNPQSMTFIPASVDDNPSLAGTGYKAKLMSLPLIERQRLLYGDWLIKESAGMYFKRDWLPITHRPPLEKDIMTLCRYWDRAATAPNKPGSDPDYTVGILMARLRSGSFVIVDCVRLRGTPLEVEQAILRTAEQDREIWGRVHIGLEQDPGQAGKFEISRYTRLLAGHSVSAYPVHKDKRTRAAPLSSQAEAGNLILFAGAWNEPLINELEGFPDAPHDDIVDACSGAFNALTTRKSGFAR